MSRFAETGSAPRHRLRRRSYLRWAAPGYAVLVLELAMLGPLMGIGKTVVYGKAMALGTALNVALDPLFIFGLSLGVGGAAMATSLATVLSADDRAATTPLSYDSIPFVFY